MNASDQDEEVNTEYFKARGEVLLDPRLLAKFKAEVEAMVLNSKKKLETLEVAVQTIELEGGGFRVRESEMEKKLDSQHSAER